MIAKISAKISISCINRSKNFLANNATFFYHFSFLIRDSNYSSQVGIVKDQDQVQLVFCALWAGVIKYEYLSLSAIHAKRAVVTLSVVLTNYNTIITRFSFDKLGMRFILYSSVSRLQRTPSWVWFFQYKKVTPREEERKLWEQKEREPEMKAPSTVFHLIHFFYLSKC